MKRITRLRNCLLGCVLCMTFSSMATAGWYESWHQTYCRWTGYGFGDGYHSCTNSCGTCPGACPTGAACAISSKPLGTESVAQRTGVAGPSFWSASVLPPDGLRVVRGEEHLKSATQKQPRLSRLPAIDTTNQVRLSERP